MTLENQINEKYIDPMGNHHKMLNPGNMPQYGYKYCIGGKTGYTDKWPLYSRDFCKKRKYGT